MLKISKIKLTIILSAIALLSMGAVESAHQSIQSGNKEIPLSAGRDIRTIRTPEDLTRQEFENLKPRKDGIRYYFGEFQSVRNDKGRTLRKIDMYFVSLLPLDYTSTDRFADKIIGEGGGFDTVEKLLETVPNLIAYLESISTGKIEKRIEKVGKYERISIDYFIDPKKVEAKYPGLTTLISNHFRKLSIKLLNRNGNLLLDFLYTKDHAVIKALVDPKGFFIATNEKNEPVEQGGDRAIGLEEAREGMRVYLDIGFETRATLADILKLFIVEAEQIRVLVNLKLDAKKLYIVWKVVDVNLNNVSVAGFDATPIRNNLMSLKDTMNGTIAFQPANIFGAGSDKLTFVRIFGTGEEVEHWLIRVALFTWEKIGQDILTDLTLPISDALYAVSRDISLTNSKKGD